MNKIITASLICGVLWAPCARAGYMTYAEMISYINDGVPQGIVEYNHCKTAHNVGGCATQEQWNTYEYAEFLQDYNGDEVKAKDEYCKYLTGSETTSWFAEWTCDSCLSGYVQKVRGCVPDNSVGGFPGFEECYQQELKGGYNGPGAIYTCQCSDLFSETGRTGYLFRGCSTSSIEFKCDASNKYYQTSTSKTPTCTVSTDSDGNFTFSRCSGCSKCNDTSELWRNANTGYQRAYKKKFTSGAPSTCTDVNLDKWRCAMGYYGTSTNGTSGCNACPSFERAGLTEICNSGGSCPYIKSTPGSNTQITDCIAGTYEPYLDVYLNDTTGKFHWWPVDDTINSYGECNWQ